MRCQQSFRQYPPIGTFHAFSFPKNSQPNKSPSTTDPLGDFWHPPTPLPPPPPFHPSTIFSNSQFIQYNSPFYSPIWLHHPPIQTFVTFPSTFGQMVNIPLLNRDSEWLRQWIDQKASQPEIQKKLVLVVVSIALLLDNMLYMVNE